MLISLSAKKQTGKNTSAHMMQFIIENYKEGLNADSMFAFYLLDYNYDFKKTEQKQFASKIKQIVSLLINCDIKDLENESFKNKILPEEWWKIKITSLNLQNEPETVYFDYLTEQNKFEDYKKDVNHCIMSEYVEKMTPRLMLQLIGTEGMRDTIHPNIWVTSLFSDYKETDNWFITDCRFPNEIKAIKARDGITIKINRQTTPSLDGETFITKLQITHPSETALDDYTEWDYIIDNNGTFKELFIELFKILKNEKYI